MIIEMYNLRPRKMINYDENAYFDSIGIEEMKIKKFVNQAEKEKYKLRLICQLRSALHAAHNAPIKMRLFYAMESINYGMEYIHNIGDSENLRLVIKNKIHEFMNEPKMIIYKNQLEKYFDQLN